MLLSVDARSEAWDCGRSLAGIVGSNVAGGNGCLSCECCVVSGRGLCDETITQSEESYWELSVRVSLRKLKNEALT